MTDILSKYGFTEAERISLGLPYHTMEMVVAKIKRSPTTATVGSWGGGARIGDEHIKPGMSCLCTLNGGEETCVIPVSTPGFCSGT